MKRIKKILKWSGIILGGLLGIGLIANALFVWSTDTRLERQLAEIRAAGDPIALADLTPAPVPPEENAATYLRRAEADVEAIDKETANVRSAADYPGFLLPLEDQKVVKAAFLAHAGVFPLLKQAADCPGNDPGLDYTLSAQEFLSMSLSDLNKVRQPARVLRHRANLLLAEGKRDEVVRTSLMIFRLARHQNPMFVGYLMALAVRGYAIESAAEALQTGPVSKELQKALDDELAIQERMDGFTWALKSERAFAIESFRDLVPLRSFWLISRGFWNRQESGCVDLYSILIALADDPRPDREIERTIESKISATPRIASALMGPGLKPFFQSVARVRARIRALRVLNAVHTRVLAGNNEIPKLTDFGLPRETTTDPFTGEPLHVKRTPQGWLIYSVGPNYQDDGGKLDDPAKGDIGIGPPPASPILRDGK
jgi:hypothetical protein